MRGIETALLLVLFIGLVIWVYSKKRKSSFDEAANLPFIDDDDHLEPNKNHVANNTQGDNND